MSKSFDKKGLNAGIICTVALFVFLLNHNVYSRDSFGLFGISFNLINDCGERIIKSVEVDEPKFKGKLKINYSATNDSFWEMMLINNFRQVSFVINDMDEKKVQKVCLPKTSMQVRSCVIDLKIKNLYKGINDVVLILKKKNDEFDEKILKRNAYTYRFSIKRSTRSNKSFKIKYSDEYQIIDKNVEQAMICLESPMMDDNNYLIRMDKPTKESKVRIPIYIDKTRLILSTRFRGDFEKGIQDNEKHSLAVFGLLNGELVSIKGKEKVIFYKLSLRDQILINPQITIKKKAHNRVIFFAVSYPYSLPNSFLKTYKMVNWSTVLCSQEINILATK